MAFRLASTPIMQKGQRRRPRVVSDAPGQRSPRERDAKHLECVAQLPCVICGAEGVHVAHVRYASAEDDAPLTGKSEKPSDWRTVPLCPAHHTDGPDAQHQFGEREWWQAHRINPYALARALFNMTGQVEKMRFLISHAKQLFPARNQ